MVTVTVLASGSSGNSTLISSGPTNILIDVGLSGKETAARLQSVGVSPSKLSGILITHEHSDHIRGLGVLAKSLKIPVYMSAAALETCGLKESLPCFEPIVAGQPLHIGDFKVTPFSTPHDSVDPLAFTLECHGFKISTVTDIGYLSGLIKERIARSDCLILESNHDMAMLKVGPYPWALKQRILGRHGHLSNDALAEFLTHDFDGSARYLFLAHLSRTNNHPEIARQAAVSALGARLELLETWDTRLKMTYQDSPSETIHLD
ncbi:MAG: MBL fold metallo-hydrolase [Acidobacteria bacterium]|nr:MBL fold metallo-hydrolase [Acidobacteriota bacterium]MBI3657186.1 MBL fold metallo-hydrolase [Acidobacteriota bacterium]